MPCSPGTYKNFTGPEPCSNCSANFFSAEAATECQSISNNKTNTTSSAAGSLENYVSRPVATQPTINSMCASSSSMAVSAMTGAGNPCASQLQIQKATDYASISTKLNNVNYAFNSTIHQNMFPGFDLPDEVRTCNTSFHRADKTEPYLFATGRSTTCWQRL